MSESHEIQRVEENLPEKANNPLSILSQAVERGMDADTMERLCALAERWEDRNAAKEFAEALREFKARCPIIRKTKQGHTNKYAPLDRISAVIDPILGDLGLTYKWESDVSETVERVTCVLRHVSGHTETSSATCKRLPETKAMNSAQAATATRSYMRRETLIGVLGITTADEDMDGADPTTITEEQALALHAALVDTGGDVAKFCTFMRVESLSEIREQDYDRAMKAIRDAAKRRAAQR